jgi:hypothetical protein
MAGASARTVQDLQRVVQYLEGGYKEGLENAVGDPAMRSM